MPFKYEGDAIALQDVNGKKLPVFIHPDGKEAAFDADSAVTTIGRLNFEAKGHRERAEAAEEKYKPFEGFDLDAGRKAIETVANFEGKKLIDSGEVEKLKDQVGKSWQEKLDSTTKTFTKQLEEERAARALDHQALVEEKIGGSFARSKFVSEKLAIPGDLVQARFGRNFKLEEGKVTAYDAAGNKLFSRVRPSELADFDEALEILTDAYPYKEQILKGSGASGTGAPSGGGGNANGKKTVPRAQWDAMNSTDRMAFSKAGGSVVD